MDIVGILGNILLISCHYSQSTSSPYATNTHCAITHETKLEIIGESRYHSASAFVGNVLANLIKVLKGTNGFKIANLSLLRYITEILFAMIFAVGRRPKAMAHGPL